MRTFFLVYWRSFSVFAWLTASSLGPFLFLVTYLLFVLGQFIQVNSGILIINPPHFSGTHVCLPFASSLAFVTHWIQLMLPDGMLIIWLAWSHAGLVSLQVSSCVQCHVKKTTFHSPSIFQCLHSFCPLFHNAPWALRDFISVYYLQLGTQ